MKGWDYPEHLAGRVFWVVVHGDVAGIEEHAPRAVGLAGLTWA